jgi:hypothetical protein
MNEASMMMPQKNRDGLEDDFFLCMDVGRESIVREG